MDYSTVLYVYFVSIMYYSLDPLCFSSALQAVHALQWEQLPQDFPFFLFFIKDLMIPVTIRIRRSVIRIVPIFPIIHEIICSLLTYLAAASAIFSLSASLYFLKNNM